MNQLNLYKDSGIYKLTARMLVFIVLVIALCRVTRGYIMPAVTLLGVCLAFANYLGWALVFFVMMPFLAVTNSAITGSSSSLWGISIRLGPLLIGLILAIRGATRQGTHKLPFIGMVPFLMVAAISAVDGWVPSVSLTKLVNFVFFLFGIWFGTQNLQERPKDVLLLRGLFLAMACFLVFGSIVTIAIPSVGYATGLKWAMMQGGVDFANEIFKEQQADSLVTLFCGVMNHSQTLAPLLAVTVGWVLCDMLLLERRFCWLHLSIVLFALPMTYMTRSRVGLVSVTVAILMSAFYAVRKVQLPTRMRARLNQGIIVSSIVLIGMVVSIQMTTGAMSRWLRKTSNVEEDRRTLREALTESRLGALDRSLYEFRRNPMFGSGFQVAEYTRDLVAFNKGFIISAPIEKGIAPIMVLGETGIIGAMCFVIFLMTFYGTCIRRKYFVTLSLFTVLFATNMGEATIFSPGGTGGILWMVSVVGGFTIDTYLLYRHQLEQRWAAMGFQMVAPAFEIVEDRSGRRRMVADQSMVKRYGVKRT